MPSEVIYVIAQVDVVLEAVQITAQQKLSQKETFKRVTHDRNAKPGYGLG
jgi:hypothetical protein